MLLRYKTNKQGRAVKTADVYTAAEHKIPLRLIDDDAVRIVQRLQRAGHEAYIVGGAVRDLLGGKKPKDFDLVTDADPQTIRKLFRNSRIIGKRFKLVHVFFRDNKIIEVSTFRSIEAGTFNNLFGTIEEDALRRDFSINALYYDPVQEQLVDFVGGFKDLQKRKLQAVIPMQTIFTEDPVRMIRAIKYSTNTGCRMGFFLRRKIKAQADLLEDVSDSRITEEAFKLLQGGYAALLFGRLQEYGLLRHIFPQVAALLAAPGQKEYRQRFFASLATLDRAVQEHGESRRSLQLSYLVADYLFLASPWAREKRPPFAAVYQGIKDFLKPVTPPNVEVERCIVYVLRNRALYTEGGALPKIVPGSALEHHGEFSQDVAKLQDERNKRRRRRPKAGEAVVVPHGGEGSGSAVDVAVRSEFAAAKKRKRTRKKKAPALGPDHGHPQN